MSEPMTDGRLEHIQAWLGGGPMASLAGYLDIGNLGDVLRECVAEIDRLRAEACLCCGAGRGVYRTDQVGRPIPPKGGSGTAPVKKSPLDLLNALADALELPKSVARIVLKVDVGYVPIAYVKMIAEAPGIAESVSAHAKGVFIQKVSEVKVNDEGEIDARL